jgi:NADH-quinone oxidoreductase subunit F
MWVYKILELLRRKQQVFGKNILGSGFDLELYVHIGAAYICGEEESFDRIIEGKEEILVSNHHFLQFRLWATQPW